MKSLFSQTIHNRLNIGLFSSMLLVFFACSNTDHDQSKAPKKEVEVHTVASKFTEGNSLIPICDAKDYIDKRQLTVENIESYIQLVCDCDNLDEGPNQDERKFLCEQLGSNANVFSPKSYLIPADDMIKAFEFDVAEGTEYFPYVRAYVGTAETGDSSHLYIAQGETADEDRPIEVNGNYYLADLIYPCPASCPKKSALSYCNN